MNSKMMFFSNFLSNPKEVAAIAPSSKYLIRRILGHVALEDAECLVEYGPGVGTVTNALLKNMGEDAKLVCFETNQKFCKFMNENIKDDRLIVVNDGAENLENHLKRLNIGGIDYAFSGLPFTLIEPKSKKKIINKTRDMLKQGGKLLVYQQYSAMTRKYLKIYFKNIRTELELRNMPPSYVFVCERK